MVEIVIGIMVAVLVALGIYKVNALTRKATYLLAMFLFIVIHCGGWKDFISLIAVFLIVIIADLVCGKRTKLITSKINKKSGARDCVQLIVNCLPAVASIVLFKIRGWDVFEVMFFSAIAETVADSIASDVGVLSKRQPRDICTLKAIKPGLSGGISVLGTLSSFLVCIVTAMLYFFLFKNDINLSGVIMLSSFAGVIADSIMGSKIQVKYICPACGEVTEKEIHCDERTKVFCGFACIDNCTVNFLSNILATILALVFASIM